MPCSVFIAQSIDGYIAGPDGEVDWLRDIDNPAESDFGFSSFISKIDAVIMGRMTFEKVLEFGVWPYEKPVFVASHSIATVPDALIGKVQIINATPTKIVSILAQKGCKNLYIDGGQLIRSFIDERLIDEFYISTLPILLGDGVPLFTQELHSVKLELVSSEIFINQLVVSHYRVLNYQLR